MTEHCFDHDRLDVYRLAIEYVANSLDTSRSLEEIIAMFGISGCERPNRFRSTLPKVMENEA